MIGKRIPQPLRLKFFNKDVVSYKKHKLSFHDCILIFVEDAGGKAKQFML